MRWSSSLGRAIVAVVTHGLVLVGAPLAAHADATLRVVSATECPGPRQLEEAMPEGVRFADEAGLVLETSRVGLTTRARLVGPDGTVVERAIRSADCAAIALAIGEIVRARLLELRMLPEPDADLGAADASATSADASASETHDPHAPAADAHGAASGPGEIDAPSDTPDTTAPPRGEPVPDAPSSERSSPPTDPAPMAAGDGRQPASGAAAEGELGERSRDDGRGLAARIALVAGPTIATDGLLSGGGRAALSLATDVLLFRLALAVVAPEVRGPSDERVELVPVDLTLGFGLSSRDEVRIEGGAEVGLELVLVRSLDLPTGASPRALPLVGPWLAVAAEVLPLLALRAELSVTFLPVTERYVVQPAGVVARTPIARGSLFVGAEVVIP